MIFTKRFFKCQACGNYDFAIEHLFEMKSKSFGPWYCDQCGVVHFGKLIDGQWVITFDKEDVLKKNRIAVLELIPNAVVEIHVEHFDFSRNKKENDDPHFFYEEHQCPLNLIRRAKEIVINENEDLHGAFKLIEIKEPSSDETLS